MPEIGYSVLFNMREIIIGKNDAGQRLDKFLTKALDLPIGLLYKSIRLKKIKVNRKRAEIGQLLYEGDTLQCFLAPEFFSRLDGHETADITLSNIQVHLNIIYEDENIMLLDKPQGISVHEDDTDNINTLINHVKAYLYQKGEYDPDGEMSFAPALCNRIDRNTGGIVIAAKNAETLRIMNEKIKLREIDKRYLALVHGTPKKKSDILKGYLIKDSKTNTVRVYDSNAPRGAKEIITGYRVLSSHGGTSLIEVELMTGRTHQIRAHMAHIGHPLVGDGKYGINRIDKKDGHKHQALYSYKLKFSFKTDAGILGYLCDREFSVPKENIYFTKGFI
jgi:23S rRNA pseudouridine955/2504/2580 synthase